MTGLLEMWHRLLTFYDFMEPKGLPKNCLKQQPWMVMMLLVVVAMMFTLVMPQVKTNDW